MVHANTKGEDGAVTFRLPLELKTELAKMAKKRHMSLGGLLRTMARDQVEHEKNRAFLDQARRDGEKLAALARKPKGHEALAMTWAEAAATEIEGWTE